MNKIKKRDSNGINWVFNYVLNWFTFRNCHNDFQSVIPNIKNGKLWIMQNLDYHITHYKCYKTFRIITWLSLLICTYPRQLFPDKEGEKSNE